MQKRIFAIMLPLLILSACSLEEKYYSAVTPETYYTSKSAVYSALVRPFTHWRWFQTYDRFQLQEYTGDVLCAPQRYQHWEDGSEWKQLHYHTWTPDHPCIAETYRAIGMGISLAYSIMQDLEDLDYTTVGLTAADQADHVNQLRCLAAYFYLKGLDYFGGIPLYTGYSVEARPRATAREVFDFVEKTLKEAIPYLEANGRGDRQEGAIKQATAAALLAELYFNAETYVGEDCFSECAVICQDIIDGVYGYYALERDWTQIFGFDNEYSTENIWQAPSQNSQYQFTWIYSDHLPYNIATYFDCERFGASNGGCLQPSHRPNGTEYNFTLGMPWVKFEDTDIRKQNYHYAGSKVWSGMFLAGTLTNPETGQTVTGAYDYSGETLNLVDYIGLMKQVGKTYPSVDELPSDMSSGEENSGIRYIKYPTPNTADKAYRWNPDWPVIRLAEIYYMLAECKFRAGDKAGAATLFNTVRSRYFNGSDPDPVTASNIDKYRILDEWMLEFLGEGRRRTDLIRWDAFETESWWDFTPSGDKTKELFPIPQSVISTNNLLEQNPGY